MAAPSTPAPTPDDVTVVLGVAEVVLPGAVEVALLDDEVLDEAVDDDAVEEDEDEDEDVDDVVVVAGAQFTQKVLCFCGSWLKSSLKCSPWMFTGASPLACALLTSVCTLTVSRSWMPPVVLLYVQECE